MRLIQEFKEFAIRGNITDLAVGVIIGGAFNKIISSFVNDIIMPPLGYVIGGVNLKDLKWTFPQTSGASPVSINYGSFLQNIFEFLIIALSVFIAVKLINAVRRRLPPRALPRPPLPPATRA